MAEVVHGLREDGVDDGQDVLARQHGKELGELRLAEPRRVEEAVVVFRGGREEDHDLRRGDHGRADQFRHGLRGHHFQWLAPV